MLQRVLQCLCGLLADASYANWSPVEHGDDSCLVLSSGLLSLLITSFVVPLSLTWMFCNVRLISPVASAFGRQHPAGRPFCYRPPSFLRVAAHNIWNSLPHDVQSAPSLPVFRSRLKTHLFRRAFPDILASIFVGFYSWSFLTIVS
jgi:hypothetical protein